MTILAALLLVLTAATEPPSAEVADPFRPPDTGMRLPGAYLHVAPGVIAVDVRACNYHGYAWGLSGGRFIPRRKHLAIAVGGFAEHIMLAVFTLHADRFHLLHVGPELRVGASNPRVFGYGLARLGVNLSLGDRNFAGVQFLATLGAGVQGALGPKRRVLLGLEPAFEVVAPTWYLVHVRTFVGVRF